MIKKYATFIFPEAEPERGFDKNIFYFNWL